MAIKICLKSIERSITKTQRSKIPSLIPRPKESKLVYSIAPSPRTQNLIYLPITESNEIENNIIKDVRTFFILTKRKQRK